MRESARESEHGRGEGQLVGYNNEFMRMTVKKEVR